MSVDLAIDFNTGDLLISPTKDFDLRTGQATIEQQIHVRIRVIQGEWPLDPSAGLLGSRLRELFRVPAWRARDELELVIREALEPLDDIRVTKVETMIDPKNSKQINAVLTYVITEEGEAENIDEQTLDLAIEVGV